MIGGRIGGRALALSDGAGAVGSGAGGFWWTGSGPGGFGWTGSGPQAGRTPSVTTNGAARRIFRRFMA